MDTQKTKKGDKVFIVVFERVERQEPNPSQTLVALGLLSLPHVHQIVKVPQVSPKSGQPWV
jgi:hypothetical protein